MSCFVDSFIQDFPLHNINSASVINCSYVIPTSDEEYDCFKSHTDTYISFISTQNPLHEMFCTNVNVIGSNKAYYS